MDHQEHMQESAPRTAPILLCDQCPFALPPGGDAAPELTLHRTANPQLRNREAPELNESSEPASDGSLEATPGIDLTAAPTLLDAVMERIATEQWRQDNDIQQPLAGSVVLVTPVASPDKAELGHLQRASNGAGKPAIHESYHANRTGDDNGTGTTENNTVSRQAQEAAENPVARPPEEPGKGTVQRQAEEQKSSASTGRRLAPTQEDRDAVRTQA